MQYKKINLELVVAADEADAIVEQLNSALDQMEERHTLFGGEIETVAFEHSGMPKRSALAHTMAAGKSAAIAVKTVRERVSIAFRSVI